MRRLAYFITLLILLFSLFQPSEQSLGCVYTRNLTSKSDGGSEHCLFYYLLNREYELSSNIHSLSTTPPNKLELKITIENVVIRHVELIKGSTYQFNIYGDVYMNWIDERLKWKKDGEFKDQDHLFLLNSSAIWSPHLIDHSLCNDESCNYSMDDVDIYEDGRVYAKTQFRYQAGCAVDYRKFPEEEDTCCIFFTAFEPSIFRTKFEIDGKAKEKLSRPVYAQKMYDEEQKLNTIISEHSPWVVVERTMSVTHLGGIESLEVLQVCVKAEKQMSTTRFALLIPVTLVTYVMLASPLFGALKMQLFLKLFILHIQTMCFLYLCSRTPENGFLGMRPRIYLFYELIFTISFISILVNLGVMALSRVRRTVPPSHRMFLMAKMVNRFICCTEPERDDSYHRYMEEDNAIQDHTNRAVQDYTQDWRHVYLAINNLFSSMMFSVFVLVTIFEIM